MKVLEVIEAATNLEPGEPQDESVQHLVSVLAGASCVPGPAPRRS